MSSSQQIRCSKKISPLRFTAGRRMLIGAIAPAVAGVFAFLHFAAVHKVVLYPLPCGFKVRFGLPCPSCGMTTSVLAFARGDIVQSLYIQPAAAAMCGMLIAIGIFALIAAIAGTDWGFVRSIKLKYGIVAFMVIVGGGWAVTLARAIAAFSM
ncbi:MAG: DUF2752 domain-containing protein [Sedimentisphaerales bacterium]|nr:DUF2752 domain-containing protein [Sedimentisphaerales bacterium]